MVKVDIVEGLSGAHFLEIEYNGEKSVSRIGNAQSMRDAIENILIFFPKLDNEEDDYEYHCCY